jgi:anthranilate synthase/aminodeoxychorismate synthase-like glutamine amidotransferase
MILVIDNYDSFTYNLVQFIGELGAEPDVVRSDALDVDGIRARSPRGIIISPGPGHPKDAGVSVDAIRGLTGEIPILGVCLGHQAIGLAFGGRIDRVVPLHGKWSSVEHAGTGIFRGVESPFQAGRYHSLVVAKEGFPAALEISATTGGGIVMGLRHRSAPTYGVQFHPESILTHHGKRILANFLEEAGEIAR